MQWLCSSLVDYYFIKNSACVQMRELPQPCRNCAFSAEQSEYHYKGKVFLIKKFVLYKKLTYTLIVSKMTRSALKECVICVNFGRILRVGDLLRLVHNSGRLIMNLFAVNIFYRSVVNRIFMDRLHSGYWSNSLKENI